MKVMTVIVLGAGLTGCAHPTLPPEDANECKDWAVSAAWNEGILLNQHRIPEWEKQCREKAKKIQTDPLLSTS